MIFCEKGGGGVSGWRRKRRMRKIDISRKKNNLFFTFKSERRKSEHELD